MYVCKIAPKKVYHSFKGEGKRMEKEKSAKEIPTKEETSNFWSNLWEIPIQHKEDTRWMKTLKEEYCKESQQSNHEITDEMLEKVLKRLANDKPGRDLVAGLWLKRIKSMKEHYKQQLVHLLQNKLEPRNGY